MTRRAITQFALGGAAVVLLLVTSTGSAFAEETAVEDAIRSTDLYQEVPTASEEEPRDEVGWFGPNFHLHKKSGFAYTRHMKVAERPFVFRIQGPVLRHQEAVGLAFKIRF
jgi:hypothetical protein